MKKYQRNLTIIAVIIAMAVPAAYGLQKTEVFETVADVIQNIVAKEDVVEAPTLLAEEAMRKEITLEETVDGITLLAKKINSFDITEEDKLKSIEEITYAMQSMCVSEEMMVYLNSLIKEPADVQRVIEVYSFWLDTDTDADMIGRIMEQKEMDEYLEYWYEDAFNQLTDYQNGSLTYDDVKAYYEAGLTIDDMLTANKLSRKGKYTVQELCERKLEDGEWVDIISEVKGIPVDKAKLENAEAIESGQITCAIFDLSIQSDASVEELLNQEANGEDPLETAASNISITPVMQELSEKQLIPVSALEGGVKQ